MASKSITKKNKNLLLKLSKLKEEGFHVIAFRIKANGLKEKQEKNQSKILSKLPKTLTLKENNESDILVFASEKPLSIGARILKEKYGIEVIEAEEISKNGCEISLKTEIAKFEDFNEELNKIFKEIEGKDLEELHLSFVEAPEYTGKPIVVDGIISSSSIAYLVPKKIEVFTKEGGKETIEIQEDDPINLEIIGVSKEAKEGRIRRWLGKKKVLGIVEDGFRTIYYLRLRPPVFTLEKVGEKIVDERGFEYKSYNVYIVSDSRLNIPPSTLVRLEGIPIANPKTQRTVFLVYDVQFPEEVESYDYESLRKLKEKLDSFSSIKEKVNWILDNSEAHSSIVKRRNLAFANLLAFFSPLYIKFNGEIINGWANISLIGDTTTGKSETTRKMISLLKAGTLITGETATSVGLLGTATQIEKEGWFIDWGLLVLNDRKLLAIDGAHKLPLSQWATLAEAERSGTVIIAKAAKNSAYARTRQVKIANPVEKESGKWETKPLSSFLYPIQSLRTIYDSTEIARLDLAVFSDSREVKPEEVNELRDRKVDKEFHYLKEAIRWCWGSSAEVEFEREAIEELLKSATELYNTFYCQSIPLVSIDMKFKLARLSSALAFLTLSTEDFSKVIVKKEHVQEVVEFIREEYTKAGLNVLAQSEKFEVPTEEEAEALLNKISDKTELEVEKAFQIIKFIVEQGRVTKDQLKAKFVISDNNQLRPLLAILESDGFLVRRNGLYSTSKLVQYYRVIPKDKYFKK